jgi:hypothetical protein
MKNLPCLLTLLATLGVTSALSAQTTATDGPRGPGRGGRGGPGGPGGRPGGNPIVRAIDADQNRVLSAAEVANAPAAILTLDTNADGIVSADELRPQRPADAPARPADAPVPPADDAHPRPVVPVMLALDANADGALSAAEIANAATSLKALDVNGDGKLTPDELRPLPPEGAPEGGHPHVGPPRR